MTKPNNLTDREDPKEIETLDERERDNIGVLTAGMVVPFPETDSWLTRYFNRDTPSPAQTCFAIVARVGENQTTSQGAVAERQSITDVPLASSSTVGKTTTQRWD